MSSAVAALNVADLSTPAAAPTSSRTLPTPPPEASPSNHPCMIRVAGGRQSRYRNDPYGAPVLPPLQHQPQAQATTTPPTTTHKVNALPPAFQMASRTASRVKSEIARAATFAAAPAEEEPSYTTNGFQNHVNRPNPIPTHPQWCFVRLKHEVLLYNAPFRVEVGDSVVMEGDRGENIGTVQRLVADTPRHPIQCSLIRFATDEDLHTLEQQRTKEELAKHFAQGVSDALSLSIRIVDTEFQSDGNKLTVYFSSRRMIDFRKLQRQLFKQYRCRIWLVNWADVIKAK